MYTAYPYNPTLPQVPVGNVHLMYSPATALHLQSLYGANINTLTTLPNRIFTTPHTTHLIPPQHPAYSTLPPPAVTHDSSDSENEDGTTSQSHKKRRITNSADDAVDPDLRALRSKKHNEAEVRRRTRLNELLNHLGELVHCKKIYKSAILRTAIDRINELQNRVVALGGDVWRDPPQRTTIPTVKHDIHQDTSEHAIPVPYPQTQTQSSPIDTTIDTTHNNLLYRRHSLSINPSYINNDNTGNNMVAKLEAIQHIHSTILYDAGIDMLHTSSLAFAVTAIQTGQIVDCNQAFADFLGYSRAILMEPQATVLGVTHDSSIRTTFQLIQALVTSFASGRKNAMRAIKRYTTASGAVRDAAITVWLLANKNGEFKYCACLLEPLDTTDKSNDDIQTTNITNVAESSTTTQSQSTASVTS